MISAPYRIYRNVTKTLHPFCGESLLRLRRHLNPHKEDSGENHIRHRLGKWDNKLDSSLSFTSFSENLQDKHNYQSRNDPHSNDNTAIDNDTDNNNNNNNNTAPTTIWFHAASAGESIAAVPIISKLLNEIPSSRVLLSVGTQTGRCAAKAALKQQPNLNLNLNLKRNVLVVPPPIDTPQAVDGFLLHFQPTMGIMMESELWPNLIYGSYQHNIPLSILNGRLSEKTYQRWSNGGGGGNRYVNVRFALNMLKDMLQRFDLILSQSQQDTDRYNNVLQHAIDDQQFISRPTKVATIPNVKLAPPLPSTVIQDTATATASAASTSTATAWDKKVLSAKQLYHGLKNNNNENDPKILNIVVASTHDGEEVIVAEAFKQLLPPHRLIYVPRHPERSNEIVNALSNVYDDVDVATTKMDAFGDDVLAIVDRDEKKNGNHRNHRNHRKTIVVSAMGMLTSLYAAADVAIVGGSLKNTNGNVGQHNVLESLREGCVVLYGKYSSEHFEQEVASHLVTAAATINVTPCCIQIDIENETDLPNVLEDILQSNTMRKDIRRKEVMHVANHVSDGVVEQIWLHLEKWIKKK